MQHPDCDPPPVSLPPQIIGLKPAGDPYINCTVKVKQNNNIAYVLISCMCICGFLVLPLKTKHL